MKANGTKTARKRVELGQYIVADSDICHGKPTVKGSRVMVWQVLEMVASGMDWSEISRQWRGSVSQEAIAETVRLASERFVDKDGRLLPRPRSRAA